MQPNTDMYNITLQTRGPWRQVFLHRGCNKSKHSQKTCLSIKMFLLQQSLRTCSIYKTQQSKAGKENRQELCSTFTAKHK